MGVYQKLGVRNLAIKIIDFITWVRRYGFNNGLSIFKALYRSKAGFFTLKTKYFKNAVLLRDNFSDKAIFNQVFYDRQYELQPLFKLNAAYIIDAGANIGLASIYFSHLYPSAKIIALEPQIDNYKLLKQNTTAYTNVDAMPVALWYKEENIGIQNPDSLAASFMVEAKTDAAIKGITVDYLLETKGWLYIDILKMDIEGAEKEIFSKDVNWLKKVKVLIIELHDNYKEGCTKTFFKALENYQYEAMFHHENIFIFFK